MKTAVRSALLVAALAVVIVSGTLAQQASPDKAVDPVCGMTVVKANAKATFDYKGTTYYFCNPGCKDAFAKEPEKYLKAQQAKVPAAGTPAPMGHMGHMGQGAMAGQPAQPGHMAHQAMEDCPMKAKGACAMCQPIPMTARMGMMRRGERMGMGMGMPGRPMLAAPGLAHILRLYGDKVEISVENAKDGAALKITSKDPEVVKAVQVHIAEHLAQMKKAKEAAANSAEACSCPRCAEAKQPRE